MNKKIVQILILVVALISLQHQMFSQKPEWLKPHPEGRSVFVQGILVDRADSINGLFGTIVITNSEANNESYTFKTNSMGVFQFHLAENGKYIASFESDGFIVRKIAFETFNVPEKAWKKGCMIDLKVNVDKRPDGFKDVVAMLPVATFQYVPEEKLFLFDLDATDRILKRYQAELDRASGLQTDTEKLENADEIKKD